MFGWDVKQSHLVFFSFLLLGLQLNFFRKGLKSLELVEPHVKEVAEQQHIDYRFSGLDDETDINDDDYSHYDGSDDGELSFDYGQNDPYQDVFTNNNSMKVRSDLF